MTQRWDDIKRLNLRWIIFQAMTQSVWNNASNVCTALLVAEHSNNGTLYSPHAAHTHTFNGRLSGTTRVSRYQKGKTNLDFTEARDSEWQWHQLGHMQVCTSLQTDNHASTPPEFFLQAGCPSHCPTNSVKVLKAINQCLINDCSQINMQNNYIHRNNNDQPKYNFRLFFNWHQLRSVMNINATKLLHKNGKE